MEKKIPRMSKFRAKMTPMTAGTVQTVIFNTYSIITQSPTVQPTPALTFTSHYLFLDSYGMEY